MLNKFLNNTAWHKIILFVGAFVFYGNSLSNEFVLDDVLVVKANTYVQNGISGIVDILTHDSYYGASGKVAKASGGRYRPLAVISYAIEKDFFGNTPFVFHFFNVLFYAVIILLIYRLLLTHVFKNNAGAAFICSLLFAIHPSHTEVVANIKSRDEIFSLLFLLLTLHYFLNYLKSKKVFEFAISIGAYFLALLSKEYGVVFLFAIPVTAYVFSKHSFTQIVKVSFPYWIVLVVYVLIRYMVNGIVMVDEKDLMNSPYLLATTTQKFATIIWVLLQYIKLFFIPYPLSYDYSYNQIPYVGFSNLQTIASLFLYAALVATAFYFTYKKNKSGYFLLLYLFTIFIVSNFIINVATPMADRFLFGPGLFLIVTIISLIIQYSEKKGTKILTILFGITLMLCVPAFAIVSNRNPDWKNNDVLYFEDIKKAPNSARANAFCGMNLVSEDDYNAGTPLSNLNIRQAITYFEKAYKIYPDFATMYQNWGTAYYKIGNIDSAKWAWNRYKALKPDNKFNALNDDVIAKYYYGFYNDLYTAAWKKNDKPAMLNAYREAVNSYDKMPDSWLLLGQLYQINNKNDSAVYCWKRCLSIDPQNQKAIDFIKTTNH